MRPSCHDIAFTNEATDRVELWVADVANAKAAIDKAVELDVTDPQRVGVAGHSHGALMTANLLVYTDLFRAGMTHLFRDEAVFDSSRQIRL
jgi:dipeptidyl aminopeptidase/acylaminoacyl peptidase